MFGVTVKMFIAEFFVFGHFFPEVLESAYGVASGEVDDEGKDAGTLDVAEEAETKATVKMCSLDKTGDIGDGEIGARRAGGEEGAESGSSFVVVENDSTNFGFEGCERPISDAGAAVGDAAEESGLSGVGETNETYICKEFELEFEFDLHAEVTAGCDLGLRVVTCGIMGIAKSSYTTGS